FSHLLLLSFPTRRSSDLGPGIYYTQHDLLYFKGQKEKYDCNYTFQFLRKYIAHSKLLFQFGDQWSDLTHLFTVYVSKHSHIAKEDRKSTRLHSSHVKISY